MPNHIPYYDNKNHPIVDDTSNMVQRSFFNRVLLKKGEHYTHALPGYESCCTVAAGICSIQCTEQLFTGVGSRAALFDGKPDSVYVGLGDQAEITADSSELELFIAAGRAKTVYPSFRVPPEDVDTVQYGSDETKTHRRIYHILGQKQDKRVDTLLVSELFTVGAGGWSGFPPHKHHIDSENESDHEELYLFKFNPSYGFGAQFAYVNDDDFGPVYHIKQNSVIVLDKGYHPVVAAPGYEMYYYTILVGKTRRALTQYFHPQHSYQLETIPGIKDMIQAFK